MRFIPLSVLLLGSWLVLPAVADEGRALLQRLADAERTQSFQGTFVYERNGSFRRTASGIGWARAVRHESVCYSWMVPRRRCCASMVRCSAPVVHWLTS